MTNSSTPQFLNQRAHHRLSEVIRKSADLRVRTHQSDTCRIVDFGVNCEGGLEAGLQLAAICTADLAEIQLTPAAGKLLLPQVSIRTDFPVAACLSSQYAGWKIATDSWFAMGSGPMRAVARREDLFEHLPESEDNTLAVGILEAGSLPDEAAIEKIRSSLPENCQLELAVAPTASQAGHIQVVARSLETALHKLHELNFPLDAIISGCGSAPLPPTTADDLKGIGRTNDAILYGGVVSLWVRCSDDLISVTGPRVPSCSSTSHGRTFLELFREAGHDFYGMDASLFSPAVVQFHNLETGRSFRYGSLTPELLVRSFGLQVTG